MTYSFKQMKALCLDLAEKAEPVEAKALRELAKNYETEPEWPEAKLRGFKLFGASVVLVILLAPIIFTIFRVWQIGPQ